MISETPGYFPLPKQFRSGSTWTEGASLVLAGTASLYLFGLVVQDFGSAHTGDLLLYAAVGVFFASGVGLLVANRRGRERVTIDDTHVGSRGGELVADHSLIHAAVLTLLACSGSLVGVLVCLGFPSGDAVLPMDSGQRLFFAPVAACCSALMLTYAVLYLARRNSRRITLSPSGIQIPKAVPIQSEIRWSDLKSVEAEHRTNATGVIRLASRGRQPSEIVENRIYAERLSMGAAATYWLIQFYHQHPEFRDELSDERSLTRLLSYGVVEQE